MEPLKPIFRVICISDSKFLKKDKYYDVLMEDDDSYDLSGKGWFHKMNFKTTESLREEKIEEIFKKDETRD